MQKILFVSNVVKNSAKGLGVYKKNLAQVKVLSNINAKIYFGYFETPNLFVITQGVDIIATYEPQRGIFGINYQKFYKYIQDFIFENDIELLYSRIESYSIEALSLYKKLHNKGCIVLLEIPTYPVTIQRWLGVKSEITKKHYGLFLKRLLALVHDSFGIPFIHKYVHRIVTFHNYEVIWKTQTIKAANGVDMSSVKLRKLHDKNEKIYIIGVANIAIWHGYDRVLYGIRDYLFMRTKNEPDIEFHVIGSGDELDRLKMLADKLDINKNIIFDGPKSGNDLDDYFDRADVGISVLGAHRCNATQKCDSLKSKEYCSRGLPFVTSTSESDYTSFKFVHTVSDDDTALNIRAVVEFVLNTSYKPEILTEMRMVAENKFDWLKTFDNVIKFIGEIK